MSIIYNLFATPINGDNKNVSFVGLDPIKIMREFKSKYCPKEWSIIVYSEEKPGIYQILKAQDKKIKSTGEN